MQEVRVPILKRLALGLAQHIAAALIMVLLAAVLFNAFLTVFSMAGPKTYSLELLSGNTEFEDNVIFQDIFQTAVSDVVQLAMIRNQLEEDGKLNLTKQIDVTGFLEEFGREGKDYGDATAVYELEDLIKWGRYGVEYKTRSMSMSDFVNYYQEACTAENFGIDGTGSLYFRGFQGVGVSRDSREVWNKEAVEALMEKYSKQQLEDMAFSYILGKAGKGIGVSREDDGSLTVFVEVLNCRYQTVDKKNQLFDKVSSWQQFLQLQRNIEEVISVLEKNYELYLNCIELYEDKNSNLKYVVRMRTRQGNMETFTNISVTDELDDENLTEYFADYRRYLIYYPENLEFMGNTGLTEGDIYEFMRGAQYPYPDDAYLWIGVDTSYEATGDAFYHANGMYEKIVPRMSWIMLAICALALLWVGLGMYLTVTAGNAINEEGIPVQYLNKFDHLWTEAALGFVVVSGYGAYRGYLYLQNIAKLVYETRMGALEEGFQGMINRYGSFALFGFLCSMLLSLFFYSFMRRLRAGNLYKNSMIHWLVESLGKLFSMIFTHQNAVISILLPYLIFMLVNVLAVLGIYYSRKQLFVMGMLLLIVIVLDTVVGILLFKNNAEQSDIVEGINRIRSGEVDYKLEVQKLHGSNREMADAVNNIGEGIHNAVKTSMKDERLKTDLITNVSHDIKTPLTSIINYVDLLKRQDIQQEPAKGYISILDSKSQRLKELTDDLVEASKISSGNIVLKLEKLNLGELLKQTIGEFSEKLEDKKLTVVAEIEETPAWVYGDSRRMWRVMENLFNNICKYAMEGTRVYAELLTKDDTVCLHIKNISQAQMNIHAEELTERFIRGDSARSTEGSGLGLFIAKSLTNVQGGAFEIDLDGDLFKVNITFPLYKEEETEQG